MGPLLITAGLALLVPVFWITVCCALSMTGGWSTLASHYRDQNARTESGRLFQSGKFGWVDYNGGLILKACDDGLAISVLPPFRFGHPPLFIPWSDFHPVREVHYGFYLMLEARVGSPALVTVRLPYWLKSQLIH
ncbi:hypothetical protein Pla108_36260 [Botrimarina colliarenosi]|uniref:Uncharacterized protein n=1 Tax=Botrimarina colliarenosi TaxID=2528001 RepID=A0A5C6A611_9BACT|nr:hypothetical protein Pla108_36260 [Botrimarina colliarenosi]